MDRKRCVWILLNLALAISVIDAESGEYGGCHTCGGTEGWRRVVYLNMTDPNTDCPPNWSMTNYSIRTCGRTSTGPTTCDSAYYPVSGGQYSQVCGKMKAYQWGWASGFSAYSNRRRQNTIESCLLCWCGCNSW